MVARYTWAVEEKFESYISNKPYIKNICVSNEEEPLKGMVRYTAKNNKSTIKTKTTRNVLESIRLKAQVAQ